MPLRILRVCRLTMTIVAKFLTIAQRYIDHYGGTAQVGGQISGALALGLRQYLRTYRTAIVDLRNSLGRREAASLLSLRIRTRRLAAQLRRIALCLGLAGLPNNSQQDIVVLVDSVPRGVPLVACVHNLAQQSQLSEDAAVSVSLLKSCCEPLLR